MRDVLVREYRDEQGFRAGGLAGTCLGRCGLVRWAGVAGRKKSLYWGGGEVCTVEPGGDGDSGWCGPDRTGKKSLGFGAEKYASQ
jgi:hypothetical protein